MIISVGCAGVGDFFDYGSNDNSGAVTQLDSEDISSDLEQDSQPSNKNTNSDFSTYSLDDESETDPVVEDLDPEEISSVSPLWEGSVGSDTNYMNEFSARDAFDDILGLTYPLGVSPVGATGLVPAFENDAIYAASAAGKIIRFDPVTGDEVWSTDTKHRLSGGIGVGEGLILVGTFKGKILAYDANGNQLWESTVTSEVLSPPKIYDGVVVVRTGEGRIFGLDAVDGKRKWIYQDSIPSLTVRNFAGVLVKGGGVFVGFPGGKLVAIKIDDGKIAWEAAVSKPKGVTELERITDVTSLPVADDRQICAVAYKGRLSCFEVMTGNPIWMREVSSSAGLTMDNKYVYVSEDDGAVVAYDKNNGTLIWKKKIIKKKVIAFGNISWIAPGGDRGGNLNQSSGDESNIFDFLKDYDFEKDGNAEDDWKQVKNKPDLRGGGSGFLGKYVTGWGKKSASALINKLSAPFVYGSQVVVGDSQGFVTVLKNDDGSIISQSGTDGGKIVTRPKHVPDGLIVQTTKGGIYVFGIQ
ncbi:outer membrane protein assembly factor BamB [Nitrosomonadaceae bacterium]|nr:outer membrane protein assembly factor BamB [Nitrosomonadaceae bacterium]